MHRLPPLTWTRTFEAAARLLSFTAAARELRITQSAVSQQIRLLEAHLGQPLFNRKGRRITLTEPGSRLFPSVRESFSRLDNAYSPFLSRDKGYTIWLSSNISFLMLWLMPRIPVYRQGRPLSDFKFNTTRWATDPKRSGASLEILYGDGDWVLPSERLTENVLFPVCSPAMAERLRDPADLLHADLITTHGEEHLWAEWAQAAGVGAEEIHTRYGVDLHMAALELARLGQGVALANDLLAADLLASGEIAIPVARSIRARDNYYLSFRETLGLGAEVVDFAQWMKQALKAQQLAFPRRETGIREA